MQRFNLWGRIRGFVGVQVGRWESCRTMDHPPWPGPRQIKFCTNLQRGASLPRIGSRLKRDHGLIRARSNFTNLSNFVRGSAVTRIILWVLLPAYGTVRKKARADVELLAISISPIADVATGLVGIIKIPAKHFTLGIIPSRYS